MRRLAWQLPWIAAHREALLENSCPLSVRSVLEHLHNPRALFSSAHRLLRRGGKLIIGIPFLYWIHEEPHDFHRYTRFALEKMTSDTGLVIISVVRYAGAPEVLADILTKTLAPWPRLRVNWRAPFVAEDKSALVSDTRGYANGLCLGGRKAMRWIPEFLGVVPGTACTPARVQGGREMVAEQQPAPRNLRCPEHPRERCWP